MLPPTTRVGDDSPNEISELYESYMEGLSGQHAPSPSNSSSSNSTLSSNSTPSLASIPLPTTNNWENRGAARIVTRHTDPSGHTVTTVKKKSAADFTFKTELGEGSYSTVYRAQDKETNTIYAIKMLDKRHIIKEKKVKYVNIEKNALNRLRDARGVVHLYYTFQDRFSLYFVLQYAPGGELLSLVRKYGSLSLEAARYYAAQLVSVIGYMHAHGVIHRDLKPENVLLDAGGRVLVTDFGTAKMLDPVEEDGNATGKSTGNSPVYPPVVSASSFVGTAEYVSPELLNDKSCGYGADIWAFGCVVYQMIAGKPPFKGRNEYQTFQKIIKLQYAFTAGFPTVVRDLVTRILVTDPSRRLTLPEIRAHRWFKGLSWTDTEIWDPLPPSPPGPYRMTARAMMPIVGLGDQRRVTQNGTQGQKPVGFRRQMGQKSAKTGGGFGSKSAIRGASHTRSSSRPSTRPSTRSSTRPGPTRVASVPVLDSSGLPARVAPVSAPLAAKAALAGAVLAGSKRQVHTSHTSSVNSPSAPIPRPSKSSPAIPSYIPGTTIPRPRLHTQIVRRTQSASSVTTHKSSTASSTGLDLTVSPMTALDLAWSDYLRYGDERVAKAGVVSVSRHVTTDFCTAYKGALVESPLGYSSREVARPKRGSNPGASMTFTEPFLQREKVLNDRLELETSAGAKIRSFFGGKPTNQSGSMAIRTNAGRPVYSGLVFVITNFGRALLFNQRLDSQHKKFELYAEILLIGSEVKFVEVMANARRLKAGLGYKSQPPDLNSGSFAIISPEYSLCFDVAREDLSTWTKSLADSRILQQMRALKNAGKTPQSGKTAFKAATLAAKKETSVQRSQNHRRRKPPPPIPAKMAPLPPIPRKNHHRQHSSVHNGVSYKHNRQVL